MAKGLGSMFVVLEGIDGAGKTTMIEVLKKYFAEDRDIKARFKRIVYCHEPSGEASKFCKELRNLVLEEDMEISDMTKALVFLASRSDHLEKVIEPELAKDGTLLICDRYFLSTLVYQGMIDQRCIQLISNVQELITDVVPDITIFLDISGEVFWKRHKEKANGGSNNVMDNFALKRFRAMVKSYKDWMKYGSKQIGKAFTFNANNGVEELKEEVKEKILLNSGNIY